MSGGSVLVCRDFHFSLLHETFIVHPPCVKVRFSRYKGEHSIGSKKFLPFSKITHFCVISYYIKKYPLILILIESLQISVPCPLSTLCIPIFCHIMLVVIIIVILILFSYYCFPCECSSSLDQEIPGVKKRSD